VPPSASSKQLALFSAAPVSDPAVKFPDH
jgi:hypothetical protein